MAKNPESVHPIPAFAWASRDTSGVLAPFKFSRRKTGELDVQFKVMFCGVCHSDLHMAKNEWGLSQYPVVPGHEIVGIVTEVGSKVKKVKVGDKVGVGCLVNSCRKCDQCANNFENYCSKVILTYGSDDVDGTPTYGGYSDLMVADEHFIIRWPENLPLESAPLLCAGVTVWSPMKYFGLDKPGMSLGVVGLGGLGHVAVKFAKSFGAKVTVISTSIGKKEEAIGKLGAHNFLLSTDPAQLNAAACTLDGIIDTVSAVHTVQPIVCLLKRQGKLVMVGAPGKPLDLPVFPMIVGRLSISASANGGIKETQEMIDYAAKHKIYPDVEVIKVDYINTAMERLMKQDVKYRFVIDVANSMKPK